MDTNPRLINRIRNFPFPGQSAEYDKMVNPVSLTSCFIILNMRIKVKSII